MLTLRHILSMSLPLRVATIAAIAGVVFTSPANAQTYTTCNPTQGQCPPDPALGKLVNINFAGGPSDQFTAQGNPTYGSDGVSFTVAKTGDAPTLVSKWYIMFGKYSITMKAAPGKGIVSSVVLQSDDLDEIDWEWLGAADNEVQSNFFGKGQTTSYDRAAVHALSDSQGTFHTYTVEWTESQIVWQIDGKTVRVLNAGDAKGQFPQTPCSFKIGAWSGGDPRNPPGTIQWSQGPTDYSTGPYSMVVQSLSIVDYSTGTAYTYGDQSGSWESIHSTGGTINGNSGGSAVVASAPAITSTSSGGSAFGGTHQSDSPAVTATSYPGLPAGWTVSSSGKVVPPSGAATTASQSTSSSSSPAPSPAVLCSASGYEVVTHYDQQGFLTTATVAIGVSTGWDDRGSATTVYPSNCQISQPPIAPGAILKLTSGSDAMPAATSDAAGVTSISRESGSTDGLHSFWYWAAGACTEVAVLAMALLA